MELRFWHHFRLVVHGSLIARTPLKSAGRRLHRQWVLRYGGLALPPSGDRSALHILVADAVNAPGNPVPLGMRSMSPMPSKASAPIWSGWCGCQSAADLERQAGLECSP
jgi:hypothetical protein